MTPTKEMRAAAAKVRGKAKPLLETAADKTWPGEWTNFFTLHGADLGLIREDEEWIALMTPAAGEPLAALLEYATKHREAAEKAAAEVGIAVEQIDSLTPLALAVARVINGSTNA